MTITGRDVRAQVATAVSAEVTELSEGIDVDGITEEIIRTYGLIDIGGIPSNDFWALVNRHDTARGEEA